MACSLDEVPAFDSEARGVDDEDLAAELREVGGGSGGHSAQDIRVEPVYQAAVMDLRSWGGGTESRDEIRGPFAKAKARQTPKWRPVQNCMRTEQQRQQSGGVERAHSVEKERPARSTTISARIYLPSFRDARMFIRRTVSKYTQIASLHTKPTTIIPQNIRRAVNFRP